MTGAAFTIPYMIPTQDRRKHTLQPGYTSKQVTINELGFRGDMPSGNVVVCLGDSVPFGCGVADAKTYPHYLSALNAGVPSYNMRQCLDRFRLDVLEHVPLEKIKAVTLQSANDVSLLTQWGGMWDPDVTWGQGHPSTPPSFYPPNYMLAHMKKTLEGLIELLSGIPLILLPVDPNYRDSEFAFYLDMWGEMFEAQNVLLQKLSGQSDVYYLDIRGKKHIDFFHYAPKTNRTIADTLRDFIDSL